MTDPRVCPECGSGRWMIRGAPGGGSGPSSTIQVRCFACGAGKYCGRYGEAQEWLRDTRREPQ